MNHYIDYKKLTKKELGLLILANDEKALDEHLRRVKSGEIKAKRYTLEEITEMAANSKKKAS